MVRPVAAGPPVGADNSVMIANLMSCPWMGARGKDHPHAVRILACARSYIIPRAAAT